MTPAQLREQFLLDPEVAFLNHGSFGACPRPVLQAQWHWQREMERNPVRFLGRDSAQLLRQARTALGDWLDCDAAHLAWLPNTTTGISHLARCLGQTLLRPGDEVLTTDLEYGPCATAWRAACEASGARLVVAEVPLPLEPDGFAERLLAACSPRTRLVFVSHITSTTALVLPLAGLLPALRARGIASVVDGAHAPAQIDLALEALGADFYVGNLHKWLCAPKGTAFLHARPQWHAHIAAPVVSWGTVAEQAGDADSPHDPYVGRSALERRWLWQGTRDPSAWLAVPEAIRFVQAHGAAADRARALALASATRAAVLARSGATPLAPDTALARMVAIPLPGVAFDDAPAAQQRLFDEHRIEVPLTSHRGQVYVRVSVAPYTTAEETQRLVDALATMGG